MSMTVDTPSTDVDLFSPDVVADPFPVLAQLREQSAAVYSTKYDIYVVTRYDDVRACALDWESFTSAKGVALTDGFNERLKGSVLASDPPEHDVLREVLSERLAPRGLSQVRQQLSSYAHQLVGESVRKGSFDAVVDIARVFPVNVVGDLVGLPMEGREKLHPGADATFAAFGPMDGYVLENMAKLVAYQQWMDQMANRENLTPGSWGELVMDAVDQGRLTERGAVRTINAYMTAGMDTTVNAIAALIRVFAEREDVWRALQEDPSRAAPIFEEILRLHSPVTGFFRVTTRDVTVGDVTIPADSRVLLHWAAANHDPAKYPDPETFLIDRNPIDHLAFGYGTHACAGQGLARMEATTLLEAMAAQIDTIELTGDPVAGRNPIVRAYDSVPVKVTARSS